MTDTVTAPPPTNRYVGGWYYKNPPRPEQLEVLNFVEANPDAKVIAADCPTGVGKSAICTTLGNMDGGTIITTQKVLQMQYARDWPHIPILKGAGAYTCSEQVDDKAGPSERGCDIGQYRHKCDMCPYQRAKSAFRADRLGVTNYSYTIATMTTGGNSVIPHKEWLLMDECHNTEDALIRAAEVRVNAHFCVETLGLPYAEPENIRDAKELARKAAELARQQLDALQKAMEQVTGRGGKVSGKMAQLLRSLTSLISSVATMDDDRLDTEWIMSENRDGRRHLGFTLRPLFANGLFSRFLLPLASRFFMTSATILNGGLLAKWLGIAPEEFSFLSVASPFPVDHRPIFVQPIASMAHGNIEHSLPKMARAIVKRINAYPNDKGVIHTSSFRLSYLLAEAMKHPRVLTHDSFDREAVLNQHLNSPEPTVLMSPSMFEGVDLKDDLSRFTIIPKVPYPNLADPWIKRRMQLDEEWYGWQTMKSLIQGVGRSIRSENDYADAYILDSCFEDFWRRSRYLAPKWFRRSIVTGA